MTFISASVNACARRLGGRAGPLQVRRLKGLRVFEGCQAEGGGGWGGVGVGGRRPDPGLLVPDTSRQEAEAN